MKLEIENKVVIGEGYQPQIIAEIGINHGGSLELAKQMVKSAIESGAILIKHQTHLPYLEMSQEAARVIPGNSNKSIFDIMQECALTIDEEYELCKYTRSLGGIFFSTPFCREAVDLLYDFGVPVFKIGSGECNNYPFIEYVASKKLPIILSTGMNSIESIQPAVQILRKYNIQFVLMHTTNLYPTPQKLIRIGAISHLKETFPDAIIGLSDHSISNAACLAAISLGASVVERHFTDTKERIGPDIVCSMDSHELIQLIDFSKQIFEASGGSKEALAEEKVTMNFAFASVSSLQDIRKGDIFNSSNIFPIRPSGGDFPPSAYLSLLGKRASRYIPARTQLRFADVVEL